MPLDTSKIDIMKIQNILRSMKESQSFDLIKFYHRLEQEAQDNNEPVLWSPKFREQIVHAFSGNSEISARVEKLYLEILNELYDAQETIRDKIRKSVSELLDEASSQLGI